ncbi:MAG: UPF0104 family protein [Methylobacteriaceae bacterium]|nr:UPF0104 family protein [Methylobacteriaceae bacterium]
MKRFTAFLWPLVGLAAVILSFYLLLTDQSLDRLTAREIYQSFKEISPLGYGFAACATLIAYAALAWYDRIALAHLGHKLSWLFISLVSFTTYALSHNIGASVFSGAVVRYRAYSTKGLSIAEIGLLVAFCSFTFALGTLLVGGLVLVFEPGITRRMLYGVSHILVGTARLRLVGEAMLAFVALYIAGSVFRLRPLVVGRFQLAYPRIGIVLRQLAAGPLELLGAAGIIYFALPQAGNPGYFIVLAAFLGSFSAALLSHAPGGVGVLELVFLKAMPGLPPAKVLAALIIFRVLYLIVPLIFAIGVLILFERGRLAEALRAARQRGPSP